MLTHGRPSFARAARQGPPTLCRWEDVVRGFEAIVNAQFSRGGYALSNFPKMSKDQMLRGSLFQHGAHTSFR